MKSGTLKVIALALIFVMLAPALMAQYDVIYDTPQQPMAQPMMQQPGSSAQGAMDGERDAQGNYLYGCGGFACGIFGFIAAALSNPQPNASTLAQISTSKGPDYTQAYKSAYAKKARNQNMLYAGVGWVAAVVVSLVYYTAEGAGPYMETK
ncbi:MAG: hypothetical protein U1B83_09215 [Candidatus Cloacimonadaceae bacterium]|nr:hypothetical protein [Candidatus Cloacimonadaceae bacterium]